MLHVFRGVILSTTTPSWTDEDNDENDDAVNSNDYNFITNISNCFVFGISNFCVLLLLFYSSGNIWKFFDAFYRFKEI